MIKRVFNIFLILVFAIQILPVMQMGAAFFNNGFTEEVPHAIDFEKDDLKKLQTKSDFIELSGIYSELKEIKKDKPLIPLNVTIPHNHSLEMLVPPPNC